MDVYEGYDYCHKCIASPKESASASIQRNDSCSMQSQVTATTPLKRRMDNNFSIMVIHM